MKTKLVQMLIAAIIGVIIGYSGMVLKSVADEVQVLYVSQDELMELETARIRDKPLEQLQLFFGKIERAVSLATQLPQSYQSRTSKVVYSMSSVTGEQVKSISKEIHQQIITELTKEQNESN